MGMASMHFIAQILTVFAMNMACDYVCQEDKQHRIKRVYIFVYIYIICIYIYYIISLRSYISYIIYIYYVHISPRSYIIFFFCLDPCGGGGGSTL